MKPIYCQKKRFTQETCNRYFRLPLVSMCHAFVEPGSWQESRGFVLLKQKNLFQNSRFQSMFIH
jgi:hypothetical protein